MKINKLTASFGKLNNDTLELHDGLNVISRPNESGKSTWCAFIRAMLYGVESSERAKAGYLPDKVKYAPWSGAPMQGTMEITAGGVDMTLTRTTKTKAGPMREFSALRTGTNIPVDGLDGVSAGEKLTGVSREVLRRSAFIEQGALGISGAPELEARIAAIVSTGEEDISYSKADERLRAWQRARRYNKKGSLSELENDMAEAERRLEEISADGERLGKLREAHEQAEGRCAMLEQQVTESRKQCRREALEKLSASKAALEKASNTYNDLYARARADKAALDRNILGGKEPATAAQEAKRDRAKADELKAKAENKGSPAGIIIFALLAAAAVAAGLILSPFAYAAAAIFAALGIVFGVQLKNKKAAAMEAGETRREILAKYSARSEADIDAALEDFKGLYSACMASQQEKNDAEAHLETARRRHDELEGATIADLDFSNGGTEAARLGRELAAARQERERLTAAIAQAEGRQQTMGDPMVIRSGLERQTSEHDRLEKEYEAITLAVNTLREADTEIQSRFSPALGALAAKYMSFMTDGKYDKLLINRDFSVKTGTVDDSIQRQSEYLSAGTLDLMYLAVRLAVCNLALPEEDKCPVILDDALVNFDEDRAKRAMKLLEEIAKERQVILFTCKGRN